MTAITESKDVDSIPVDELVGSLQSYELDLPKTSKSKSMALKSVDDVDVGGFVQKLLTLPRTLGISLETTTEGQEIRTPLNLKTLGIMIPLKLTTLINLEKK